MTGGARVSVVTPFYNTAKYLRECITSVLAQTLDDFEYILADNCSNDGSADIAREFAARDARIRYVRHDELLPQVANYNRALALISPDSTYCKIVQADDWIFPSCLAEMAAAADRDSRIGLISAYEMLGDTVYQTGLRYEEQTIAGREVCRRALLEDLFVFGSPNTVMYRASCVRERRPFYGLDSQTEDVDAGFEILLESDFAFVHQVLTGTRRENVSIWSGIARFQPVPLHRLMTLVRYGQQVLTPEEFQVALREHSRRHGQSMARGALAMRGSDYWEYQREGLASVGLKIKPFAIAWQIVLLAARLVLNPLDTAQRVLQRIRRVVRR